MQDAQIQRTITEINSKANALNIEHKYQLENLEKDWSHKFETF